MIAGKMSAGKMFSGKMSAGKQLSLGKMAAAAVTLGLLAPAGTSQAGTLTVKLVNGAQVQQVGAIRRWDEEGSPLRPVDPKARIDAPRMIAATRQDESTWVFAELPAGRYDLVLLSPSARTRIEGFYYPPVLEFDEFVVHGDSPPAAAAEQIATLIRRSRHYENKVEPLYFTTAQDKQVRVLVQLLRDKPTSFDAQLGEQAATLRHEIWQFTNLYGGWAKEKRTKVLDRILMPKRQLRQWTWIWDPRLGGIQISSQDKTISYQVPPSSSDQRRGLLPY